MQPEGWKSWGVGSAWWAVAVLSVLIAVGAGRADLEDGMSAPAAEVLQRALENRYELDHSEVLELRLRSRSGAERQRRMEVASKRIEGRLHSLGRFTEPEYLRGTAILTIEREDRSDDHFVYLPALDKMRRVTSAQRADRFMGTDLAYEDFERRRVADYHVEGLRESTFEGEAVSVVVGRPRYDSGYARVEFLIARSDDAILAMRYFKRGSEEPFKELSAPRARMVRRGGHVLPTRIHVRNLARGTETDVEIKHLSVNPELADQLFTAGALEAQRRIPIQH